MNFSTFLFEYREVCYAFLKRIPSFRRQNSNLKERKIVLRKKPLYTNGFLEANDGELLCTIDNKKAMWYVNKGIGEIVKEDPLTVRLKFEPAGRAVGQTGKYYQMAKENKCVVCGETNNYVRKNVVPREYRRHFPCKPSFSDLHFDYECT